MGLSIYHVEKCQKSENSSVKNQNKTQDVLPPPFYFYSEYTFSKQKDLPLIYSWEAKRLSTPTITSGCLLIVQLGLGKCKIAPCFCSPHS